MRKTSALGLVGVLGISALGGCEILDKEPPLGLLLGATKGVDVQRGNAGAAAALDTMTLFGSAREGKSDVTQEVYVTAPQANQQNRTEIIQTPDYFGPFFICSKWTDKNNDGKYDYPNEFDVKNYFNANEDKQMSFYAVTRLKRPYNILFELVNLENGDLLGSGGGNVYPREEVNEAGYNHIEVKREIMPE